MIYSVLPIYSCRLICCWLLQVAALTSLGFHLMFWFLNNSTCSSQGLVHIVVLHYLEIAGHVRIKRDVHLDGEVNCVWVPFVENL